MKTGQWQKQLLRSHLPFTAFYIFSARIRWERYLGCDDDTYAMATDNTTALLTTESHRRPLKSAGPVSPSQQLARGTEPKTRLRPDALPTPTFRADWHETKTRVAQSPPGCQRHLSRTPRPNVTRSPAVDKAFAPAQRGATNITKPLHLIGPSSQFQLPLSLRLPLPPLLP
jgi:hypothetical protein